MASPPTIIALPPLPPHDLMQLRTDLGGAIGTYQQLRPQLFVALVELQETAGGPYSIIYQRVPPEGEPAIPLKIRTQATCDVKLDLAEQPNLKSQNQAAVLTHPENYAPFKNFAITTKDKHLLHPASEAFRIGVRIEFMLNHLLAAVTTIARCAQQVGELARHGRLMCDVQPILTLDQQLPCFPYWPRINAERTVYAAELEREELILKAAEFATEMLRSADSYSGEDEGGVLRRSTLQQWNQADAGLMENYAQASASDLLANCNRMIRCIAGFDTVSLLAPDGTANSATFINESWLAGFNGTRDILCLAAVARNIDLGPLKDPSAAAYTFWVGSVPTVPRGRALKQWSNFCVTALHELKRVLMVEIAQASARGHALDGSPASQIGPAKSGAPAAPDDGSLQHGSIETPSQRPRRSLAPMENLQSETDLRASGRPQPEAAALAVLPPSPDEVAVPVMAEGRWNLIPFTKGEVAKVVGCRTTQLQKMLGTGNCRIPTRERVFVCYTNINSAWAKALMALEATKSLGSENAMTRKRTK